MHPNNPNKPKFIRIHSEHSDTFEFFGSVKKYENFRNRFRHDKFGDGDY